MSTSEPLSGETPAPPPPGPDGHAAGEALQPWAPYILQTDYETTFEYPPDLAASVYRQLLKRQS